MECLKPQADFAYDKLQQHQTNARFSGTKYLRCGQAQGCIRRLTIAMYTPLNLRRSTDTNSGLRTV